MKLWLGLTSFLLMLFVYAFYISQIDLRVRNSDLKPDHPDGFYDYKGVTNIHTELSTGSSSPLDVVSEARAAGLDFLVFTDVNQFINPDGVIGYNGNLLVMNEAEFPFLDSRLLFYSLHKKNYPLDQTDLNIYFTDLLSKTDEEVRDNFIVLAHPFVDGPTWSGPYPPGIDGIEVLNPKSLSYQAWKRSKLNVLWSLFLYPFNSRYAFLRLYKEPVEEISLWDRLGNERPTIGFTGADANAKAIPFSGTLIHFPSYQKIFEIFTNHVLLKSELTGNSQKDRIKILSAFQQGQFYMSLDLLGDPKGFLTVVKSKDKVYPMGSKVKLEKNLTLYATLPQALTDFFEIVLYKDGERLIHTNTTELKVDIKQPGTYRVTVRVSPMLPLPEGKKWMTWIYSNPFFVK